ncbi:hypothetical protein GC102_10775 [Paenibacillus sp. LMG 31460]|uniref:Apea-like HEPN domain-containing protein n=1 Tax=Paenibacillus germinis TaxID=2654979 RepID=A0ABX1Z2Y3_9BACL|nr:hypothetical protein [Paenibacillus germinis]NOU86255.1 hypothetical protein [Paenibacillus germinis]
MGDKVKLKVLFTNELPFMIQLPNDEYPVKVKISPTEEKDFVLKLRDDIFRVHFNPFANARTATYLEGEKAELENYIVRNQIANYAFSPCKSYISCSFEVGLEFQDSMYPLVTDENLIEKIKSKMIRAGIEYADTDDLTRLATEEFGNYSSDQLLEAKKEYIIDKTLTGLGGLVYPYHEALNKFIKQYSYLRGDFFVESITMHTLAGTYVQKFIDGQHYETMKHGSKIPSIMPYQKWMPDIEDAEMTTLKDRLIHGYDIPPTKDLIIMARNLAERGEYRSAIINSSAALEVAVENKIIEKMTANGKTQAEIDTYLEDTKVRFHKRCNKQLRQRTGQSFPVHNPTLWTKIDGHRNRYRHKIAHSSLMPNSKDTEEAINDFENAVNWVEAL